MGILEVILGVLSGGLGSWIGRIFSIVEKRQEYKHEYKLLQMQMQVKRAETENELAIAQENSFTVMREASYLHDSSSGDTSKWVNNVLRLVRPVLTIMLIILVFAIWFRTNDAVVKIQIIEGVLFMASAALAWWFGDRAPNNKKLPWQ